jgi:tRNA threonylcarbamoyladenosine biosynthesis protein TsaB
MKLLAIDATTPTASVALRVDDRLVSLHTICDGKTHSETLLPLIDRVLREGNLTTKELDGFIVANGPGSFTGLRIALATVKALAHAYNKPIYAISTLRAMAYHGRHFEGLICPILDARRQQVYSAVYQLDHRSGVYTERTKEDTYLLSDLLDLLRGERVLFVGDGVRAHTSILKKTLDNKHVLGDAHEALNTAYGLFWAYDQNQFTEHTYLDLEASYLRQSQAERELKTGIPHEN